MLLLCKLNCEVKKRGREAKIERREGEGIRWRDNPPGDVVEGGGEKCGASVVRTRTTRNHSSG